MGDAYCALGITSLMFDYEDRPRAARAFERGIALGSGAQGATWFYQWLGLYYHGLLCNRWDLALTTVHLAHERDPLSAYATATVGLVESWSGRAPLALEWMDRAVALDPTSFAAQFFRQYVLSGLERWSESVAEGDALLARSGRSVNPLVDLGLTLANSGDVAAARSVYQELQGRTTRDGILPSQLAALAALLGEDADVRRYVAEIRRVRSPDLLIVDSAIGGLNVHPAIQQLLVDTGITAWRGRARGPSAETS